MSKEYLGKIAYDNYCKSRDWKSVRGEPLPHWEQQDETLRAAWVRAAEAVRLELANASNPG